MADPLESLTDNDPCVLLILQLSVVRKLPILPLTVVLELQFLAPTGRTSCKPGSERGNSRDEEWSEFDDQTRRTSREFKSKYSDDGHHPVIIATA